MKSMGSSKNIVMMIMNNEIASIKIDLNSPHMKKALYNLGFHEEDFNIMYYLTQKY